MSDNRAAIRHEWDNPQERVRYIRHRLSKRETTPSVTWAEDDHADIRWLCDELARLAAVESERDALVQALMDAPNDAVIMAIDLGMREKFPRSGAFHLDDPMHVIWKAVYEATMAHDARTKVAGSE